jgi:uncharacterized protein
MAVLPVGMALLSCAAIGCSHTTARPREPAVILRPTDGAPEVRVKVELARTAEQQRVGLMYRDRLEAGAGMLFLFDHPHQLTFWMRNCYLPLDMVFIRADLRVLGVVERAAPMTDDPRAVEGASQFVLEVPGGFATAHHIGPGAAVTFIDVD